MKYIITLNTRIMLFLLLCLQKLNVYLLLRPQLKEVLYDFKTRLGDLPYEGPIPVFIQGLLHNCHPGRGSAIGTRTDLSWNWSRLSVAILLYLECLIIYVCFMIWWKIMSPVGTNCVMHRDLESWSMEHPQMFWNSALSGWVLLSSTNRNCHTQDH